MVCCITGWRYGFRDGGDRKKSILFFETKYNCTFGER